MIMFFNDKAKYIITDNLSKINNHRYYSFIDSYEREIMLGSPNIKIIKYFIAKDLIKNIGKNWDDIISSNIKTKLNNNLIKLLC